jgi:hypothetical protein
MAIPVLVTKPLGLTPIAVIVDVADLILVETYRRARRLSTRAGSSSQWALSQHIRDPRSSPYRPEESRNAYRSYEAPPED